MTAVAANHPQRIWNNPLMGDKAFGSSTGRQSTATVNYWQPTATVNYWRTHHTSPKVFLDTERFVCRNNTKEGWMQSLPGGCEEFQLHNDSYGGHAVCIKQCRAGQWYLMDPMKLTGSIRTRLAEPIRAHTHIQRGTHLNTDI